MFPKDKKIVVDAQVRYDYAKYGSTAKYKNRCALVLERKALSNSRRNGQRSIEILWGYAGFV